MAINKKTPKKSAAKKAPGPTKPLPSTKPVWQKLFVKGGTVLLLNAPAGFEQHFTGSPAATVTRSAAKAETILVFADSAVQLDATLPAALVALGPASTLWVVYRKGDKVFHRDVIAKQVTTHGLTGVAMIAIDDALSALRVKPG
jgi:hypothetical protein